MYVTITTLTLLVVLTESRGGITWSKRSHCIFRKGIEFGCVATLSLAWKGVGRSNDFFISLHLHSPEELLILCMCFTLSTMRCVQQYVYICMHTSWSHIQTFHFVIGVLLFSNNTLGFSCGEATFLSSSVPISPWIQTSW